MKKLGIALAVLVVLFLVVIFAVPALVDVNSYRGRIQSELQSRLGRPVTLGQLHLSLLPLSFRADNAAVGEDPSFQSQRPFAQASELSVSVALWPLLHKDVQVKSLELGQPKIELIRNPAGTWNFASLGQSPAAPAAAEKQPHRNVAPNQPAPAKPSAATPAPSAENKFSLADLRIIDGQLAITDLQKPQPRAVYDHIDLHLSGFAPGKSFDLEAAAHLPGSGNQLLKVKGTVGPIDNANPANTPAKLTLEAKQLAISGLQRFLNAQALAGSDATVSGTAEVNNAANNFSSNGDLMLSDVKLHGNQIGYPISANYAVANEGARLRISKGDLKLGETPLHVTGTVNMQPTPAELDLKLDASNVSIQEVARLAAASGVAFNPGMNISGRLSADVHAQGPTSQPALNGTINGNNLSISGKDLPQPVNVDSMQLSMTPAEIHSNDFSAKTGNTTVNGRFALKQYTSTAPQVDADLKTQNANLGELINIARAYGVSAVEGMSGSGAITLNVHAAGPLKNTAAMNFAGSGQLQNAQIKAPSVTEPLKVQNANINFSQNTMQLQNLAASIGSTNASGSLTLRDFVNPQVQFALKADKILVAELEKIFGASPAQKAELRDFWNIVPTANAAPAAQTGMLGKMSGAGTINVGNLTYQNLVLTNVNSKVNIDRGIFRLDPIIAQLFGGQQAGSIVVDMRSNPATYTFNSKLAKVDANQLLSSVSSLKNTLYGMLAANANTSFSSTGGSDIAKSLNGNMNLDLSNGKLAKVDLLYQLANIGKFLNTGKAISQKDYTNLVKLGGDFNIKNGLAETNNLKAVIDGGTLAAVGALNLVDQSVNMHVTAVLTKAMTDSIGGRNIGGFMNTALQNSNGELVMPILVTGSMNSPHFAPDVQQIARMKLQNLLPTSSNPAAGVLGALLGGKNAAGQNNQNQQGVQGILQQLGGNRQQQPGQTSPNMPQSDQQQPPQAQQQQQQQQQQPQQPNLQDLLKGVLKKKQQQQQQQNPPPPPPQ